MKQIIQNINNGKTLLEEVPVPAVKPGCVLIQTKRSLVSLGTERMLIEFGKAGLLGKVRQQPDKVKMVLDKMKTDGVLPTLTAVFNKLGQPLPLGYCNAGKIIEIGKDVHGFKIGDRVASNGHHAEYVCVPENLVARIPDAVTDSEACFTIIGAIGLQGIRLFKPQFGETVVVTGLGLIGLITAQLLIANGCRVIGIDVDQAKLDLAEQSGIIAVNPSSGDDPVEIVKSLQQQGADGVIITAASTDNRLISQAAQMCRKRGRIILTGVIGLNLNRSDFYEKEIRFQVSCSYGPGRYDENYEQKGRDYPFGFVRWTEKRNFEAILDALATKKLNVEPLITRKVPILEYQKIYDAMTDRTSIASILCYETCDPPLKSITISDHGFKSSGQSIGIIGAGNYTGAVILPCLKKCGAQVKYIASSGGLSAATLARRFGISFATTDLSKVYQDPDVDLVMVTTRHNLHAQMVIDTLKAKKHVFVEKPLCLNIDELKEIRQASESYGYSINIGFNRRFSPMAQKMKSLIGNSPFNVVATMNAGFIPEQSWVHDPGIGGGRIIGEACHFIDLCAYLTDSFVVSVCMSGMGKSPETNTDNASLMLKFENGSHAVINYFSNGSKSYSKERIEIFSLNRTLILDNWRMLRGYGFKNFSRMKSKQDKGQDNQFRELVTRFKQGGEPLIALQSVVNTTLAGFAAVRSLTTRQWEPV